MRVGVLEMRVHIPASAAEWRRSGNTRIDLALHCLDSGQRLSDEVVCRLIELLVRPRPDRLLRRLGNPREHVEHQTVSAAQYGLVAEIPGYADTRLPTVPCRVLQVGLFSHANVGAVRQTGERSVAWNTRRLTRLAARPRQLTASDQPVSRGIIEPVVHTSRQLRDALFVKPH